MPDYEVLTDVDSGLNEDRDPREDLVEDLITMVSSFVGKLYGVSRKYEKVVEDARKLIEDPLSNSKFTLSQ